MISTLYWLAGLGGLALAGTAGFEFSGGGGTSGTPSDAQNSSTNGASSGSDPFTRFDSLFQQYGTQYRVPWRWLKAICMDESSLGQNPSVAAGIANPSDIDDSVSDDGKSWGLMQMTLPTAGDFEPGTTAQDLNDPATSVRLAARYVSTLIKRFGIGDRTSIFRAYNGGPGFASTVQGQRDTPAYAARVNSFLSQILAQQPGDELEGYT